MTAMALWTSFSLALLMNLLVLMGATAGQGATNGGPDTPILRLHDFFKLPIGPRGLEPTDTLLRCKDQQVRVQGYMVQEEEPVPGLFMLTPTPVAIAELADGPADYLPAATLFVHLPHSNAGQIVGYRPGLWTLSGVLRLGVQEEPNGRASYVRLLLDELTAASTPDNHPPDWRSQGVSGHDPQHGEGVRF